MAAKPLKKVLTLTYKKIYINIIPLWPSYYMPQNPQKIVSQTEIKHYNQFRSVRSEALRLLQITTDTGMKIKVETTVK